MANRCGTDLGFMTFVCESTVMAVKVNEWRHLLPSLVTSLVLGIREQTDILTRDHQFLFENHLFNDPAFVIHEEEKEEQEEFRWREIRRSADALSIERSQIEMCRVQTRHVSDSFQSLQRFYLSSQYPRWDPHYSLQSRTRRRSPLFSLLPRLT